MWMRPSRTTELLARYEQVNKVKVLFETGLRKRESCLWMHVVCVLAAGDKYGQIRVEVASNKSTLRFQSSHINI